MLRFLNSSLRWFMDIWDQKRGSHEFYGLDADSSLLIAWVCDTTDSEWEYGVYLINNSNYRLWVTERRGAFMSVDYDLLDLGSTKTLEREIGPRKCVKIDAITDIGQLDFTSWYSLSVRSKNRSFDNFQTSFRVWISMKEERMLPIIRKDGFIFGILNLTTGVFADVFNWPKYAR